MGTTYSIKIITHNKPLNIDSIHNAVDSLLNNINYKLSTYIEDSEINKFNSHSSVDGFYSSDMLIELVQKSKYHYDISNGDFDITVGPIVREWGFSTSFNSEMLPDSLAISQLLGHVGTDYISYKNNYIYKNNPFVEIDLSAIAKGWAADEIADFLDSKKNIENYLIEIGGEVVVSGTNFYNKPWEIGIRHPMNNLNKIKNNYFHILKLSDMAVATSGTYQNYFHYNGQTYSHIIDPKNGFPVKHEIISATVVSEKCVDADAIATAIMVKGAAIGLDWVNSLKGVEALLILKDEKEAFISVESDGFNDF